MVCEALKGNPYFEKSRIEVDREGYTYTIDTLGILNEQYRGIADLYYIIGADVLYDLLTWKDYEKVFGICKFIAALRPGTGKEGFRERIKYLEDRFSASILEAEIPLIEISSTMIRGKRRKIHKIPCSGNGGELYKKRRIVS